MKQETIGLSAIGIAATVALCIIIDFILEIINF